MKGILEILNAYNGGKLLLALYLVCLIYLWRYEKSRNQRLLLVWLPLFFSSALSAAAGLPDLQPH